MKKGTGTNCKAAASRLNNYRKTEYRSCTETST